MDLNSSPISHVYVEESFSYQWRIESYEKLFQLSRRSQEFSVTSQRLLIKMDENRSVWIYLHLYPGVRQCPRINWSLISCPPEIKQCLMLSKFDVSILTSEHENTFNINGISSAVRLCDSELISLGVPNFMLVEQSDLLLPNGVLNLTVSGTMTAWVPHRTSGIVEQAELVTAPNLATHLGDCLRKEDFCDVVISVREKLFHCHKAILCARSPVFERMFKHSSLENINSSVEIEDMESDVFEQLVHFIYTDTCPKLNEMPEKIVYGAEKYDLPLLKSMCINEMVTNISVNNAAVYLVCAYTYNVPKAKECMLMFVRENAKEIMNSEAWTDVQNGSTFKSIAEELAKDVLSMLAEERVPAMERN